MTRLLMAAAALAILPLGATAQVDTDRAILLELHEQLLQAHRNNDVDAWMEVEAEEYTSVNGGSVSFPSAESRRSGRAAYLESAEFSVYRDLREPLVTVSDDGTLGWVVAEVEVMGEIAGPDGGRQAFHDIWAWVELYRNDGTGWKMVGNASNRRDPGD